MIGHQQRHASQAGADPEDDSRKVCAQRVIERVRPDEAADDQRDVADSADHQRARLVAVEQPRRRHALLRNCFQVSFHTHFFGVPSSSFGGACCSGRDAPPISLFMAGIGLAPAGEISSLLPFPPEASAWFSGTPSTVICDASCSFPRWSAGTSAVVPLWEYCNARMYAAIAQRSA